MGFRGDWGLNITELNYVGPNPLNTVTINDVLGNFTYYQFNLLYGKGNYKSYDEKGNITWQGITTGIGFGFGGSWARGRTYKKLILWKIIQKNIFYILLLLWYFF